ncbi:MAG: FecR family protein [Bacteroidales bacterium]
MKDPIYSLLQKYINNTITADEREILRSMMDGMSQEDLSEVIARVWEDYEPTTIGEYKSFEEFDKRLRPQTSKGVIISPLWRSILKVAAIVAIPLSLGLTAYMYKQVSSMRDHLERNFVFSTKSGDCSEVLLPDGTKVILNSASTLSYPADYGMNERKVYLSGEAFLDVKKDSIRSFIVDLEKLQIRVLGTTFNVKAYADSDLIETTLIEGSVEIATCNNRRVILEPNEKASYSKTSGGLWRENSEVIYEKAWLDGSLVFRSSSFTEVLLSLERYYGLKIEVSGKIPKEKFTGHIKEKNIWTVLQMLQNHYPFTYERNYDTIFISMK